jgi:3-dehydro-L-gulonate 2-dehydrogenase
MIRVPHAELLAALGAALRPLGFAPDDAARCARLFAEADLDGVHSHGVARFPRFVRAVRDGVVDPSATPALAAARGALERWDGRRGPGNLNARRMTARAVELARAHGVGCVALANTNHWMRGGSYGWQAAEAGVVAICWTNTMPNLPPWGAERPLLGNNPLVIAVPRPPAHVVLDMAMSQFSFGALESYRRRGERLPVPGGFDAAGALTDDPGAIEASGRPLPIGYWKGSGLALVLDLVAAMLSAGRATHEVAPDPARETGLSQVFVALDPSFGGAAAAAAAARETVDRVLEHLRAGGGGGARYPGERTLRLREEHLRGGVPVDPEVWDRVRELAAEAGGGG